MTKRTVSAAAIGLPERACSRRQAFVPIASLLAIGSIATASNAMASPTADASLFAAWDALKKAHEDLHNAVDDPKVHDVIYDEMGVHEVILEDTPATTTAGLMLKLKFCFLKLNSMQSGDQFAFYGEPQSEDDRTDWGEDILYKIITNHPQFAA